LTQVWKCRIKFGTFRAVLVRAYRLAKSNNGALGVDGESFEDIESRGPYGVMEWLKGLGKELPDKTYQPQPSTALSRND
jgi:hypothetical protein